MTRKRQALVAVIAALAVVRVACLQGLVFPVRISGDSMAEAIVGEHFDVKCGDCGFPFRCGTALSSTDLAVCPNCGYRDNRPTETSRGERVLVDRFAFVGRGPRRWDLAALRRDRDGLVVKRVVGLPGERIAIVAGDVFIDGGILRKSLTEFRDVATLVHDDAFRPTRDHSLPARWRPQDAQSGWQSEERGFRWNAPSTSDSERTSQDWLTYHHWRCYQSPWPRTDEAPVSDNVAYNQAESRQLNSVGDLLLACSVRLSSSSALQVRIHDGREYLSFGLEADRNKLTLMRGGRVLTEIRARIPVAAWCQLEFGVFDKQAVLALNRRTLVAVRYANPVFGGGASGHAADAGSCISQPVGLCAAGGPLQLTDLRVYRDIFYLDQSPVSPVAAAAPLEGWCVLGDNTAVSRDSRQSSGLAAERNVFLGKVLRATWNSGR
jgi:signal peptidase I